MPRKSDIISINNKKLDRRVKLTDTQREEIKANRDGLSQRKLAKIYGVSRRTIQFILHPEKLEQNLQRRAERGGTKQYYDKEKQRKYMKAHRDYKKKLYLEGKIGKE
jgi:transposase